MADQTPDDKTLLTNGSSTIEPPHVPEYDLLRRIGSGSYGEVWLARSVTGMYRAVKVVYRRTFERSRPFDREFSGMQKFEPVSRSHPGLVSILHVGRNDEAGFFYYVMELADDFSTGQEINPRSYIPKTLATEVSNRGRMALDECLKVGISLTGALTQLHERKLIHRDIKPSNIIFVHGNPKLADIGLVAAMDETRSFVGTEGFVPLEGPGSPQADVFALGKVLYEIATGKDRLQFPELPADVNQLPDHEKLLELNEIVLKACEQDRRSRYRSAAEMEADLCALQQGKSLRRAASLRRRLLVGGFAGALALAVVSLIVAQRTEPPPKPPEAAGIVASQSSLPWKRSDNFPFPGYEFEPVEEGGHLYVIGGSRKNRGPSAFTVKVQEDGTLGVWKELPPLPEPAEAPGIANFNGWIYAALETGTVYRARTTENGELTQWEKEKDAAAWHGGRSSLRAFRDHLYLFGGFHYRPFDDVYVTPILPNGSLGGWRKTTAMPEPRQNASIQFLNDRVYIVGGVTSGDQILNSTYSASVNADGSLGEWRREADLPTSLWMQSSMLLGERLVLFGGMKKYDSGTSRSMLCANISSDNGSITGWVTLGDLPHSFAVGPGVVHEAMSGHVYLIGGLTGYRGQLTAQTWCISARVLKEVYVLGQVQH